jgi:hypothetical protein
MLLAVAVTLTLVTKVQADNKALTTGSAQIKSMFTLPANSRDGRDPFFPESTRVIDAEVAASHTVEITSLRVPGISGPPGHLLAIINTHTFAVGEEGDVKTASGPVHIRCLDIQANSVLVEINGQVHRINVDEQ